MRDAVRQPRSASRVPATFEYCIQCFLLESGATFGDLAAQIRSFQRYGVPDSINVRIGPLLH